MSQQQLQAEESLLSDRNSNELLFINLATVMSRMNSIPGLHKCVAVVRHPICDSPLFVGEHKPQQPTHIFAHLQGAQGRHTAANLAKEPKFPAYLYETYFVLRIIVTFRHNETKQEARSN
jgi:hypothetical protein